MSSTDGKPKQLTLGFISKWKEAQELWILSMAPLVAAARAEGKIYTIGDNDAIMTVFPPGVKIMGSEAQKSTKQSKALEAYLDHNSPEQKKYVNQIVNDFGFTHRYYILNLLNVATSCSG